MYSVSAMKGVAFVIALLGLTLVASADSLKAEIKASDKQICGAILTKNFPLLKKSVLSGVTPDFVYIENRPGKPLTATQMVSEMQMGLSAMQKITIATTQLLSYTVSGGTVVTKTNRTVGGLVVGKDKKPHTMLSSGMSTETYVKQGGRWKMSKMVWTDGPMTMDGKPMAMPK